MHKLRENIDKELKSIEEKGLTSSNLDNAYKLIEMKKGLDKIDMLEGGEYSNDGYSRDRGGRGGYSREGGYGQEGDYSNGYDNNSSYRRGRSATTGRYIHRPNYSRLSGDDTDMDEYRRRKSEYSNSRDGESKNKMLDALEDFMSGVQGMIKQICRDSDCAEERNIVMKHIRQMADMY